MKELTITCVYCATENKIHPQQTLIFCFNCKNELITTTTLF